MRDRARQRGRRLLDRERRPDGRAHRRLDHRRAGDDADRPRVPAHARRRHRRASARSASTPAAATSSSRSTPTTGRHGRHRDEPAGVALVGAGVQGHRLPDRQDRGQARRRLHARRDPQRHHRRDAGGVRADARLRRGEGAAVRVREVPGRRPDADHHDEERRRGDGDRPHLRRGAAEGAALAGAAAARRSTGAATRPALDDGAAGAGSALPHRRPASSPCSRRCAPARRVERGLPRRPASTRGSSTRSLLLDEVARRGRAPPPSSTPTLLRRAKRHGFSDAQIGELRGAAARTASASVRHALGVRPVYKTVDTCAAEFAARTPYHYSSYDEETEVAPREPAGGAHPRLAGRTGSGRASSSTTPACTRRSRCARPGFETVMVNCNPETVSTDYDTSDRLYFEPLTLEDVLEVVHAEQRGRPGRRRHRAARRPDPARASPSALEGRRACRSSAPRRRRSTWPRSAARSARCSREAGPARAAARHRHVVRARRGDRRRDRLPGAGPAVATCSAAAAWRSSTTTTTLARLHRAGDRRSAPSTRCSSTGSSTTRSRSTSTRSSTAPSSTSAA